MRGWLVCCLVACGGSHDDAPDIAKTGVTEVEYRLTAPVDVGAVKRTLEDAHLTVYRASLTPEGYLIVQFPFAKVDAAKQEAAVAALKQRFALESAAWAGERLHLRGSSPPPEAELRAAIAGAGLEVTDVQVVPEPEVGETIVTVTVAGPELAYERAIEAAFPVESPPLSVESVGPTRH